MKPAIAYEQAICRVGLIACSAFLMLSTEYAKGIGNATARDETVVAGILAYVLAFAFLAIAAIGRFSTTTVGRLVLAGTIAGLMLNFYATIQANEGRYLFDVLPVTHRSAELIGDGINPYSYRDNPDFIRETAERYDAPLLLFTRTSDGRLMDQLLQYPAGHVLPFVPFVEAGLEDIRWVSAGAMLFLVALVWWAVPDFTRPLVIVPFLVDALWTMASPLIGAVDHMWLLPLLTMAILLSKQRLTWAAISFGIAASMRQHTWLLAPFLLIWLWKTLDSDHKVRPILQLSAVSFGVFLLVNLPFLVWSPSDWLHGVTYPILTDLNNVGTGLRDLRYLGFDAGRTFYTASAIFVMGVLLFAYGRNFSSLQHAIWIFPPIIIWFTPRALFYYFHPWIFLLLLSLLLRPPSGDQPAAK